MNGLDELRRTLESHADEVSTYDVQERRTAVRERILVERRRRTGGAVAAVVALVALVAGIAAFPDSTERSGPDPAEKVVVFGVEVPQTMSSLGYTYELVGGVDEVGPDGSYRVAASDEARLISWATQGSDQLVTVRNALSADEAGSSEKYSPDFEDFTLVEAGVEGQIDFVSSGPVAVATYEITDERPAGVTADGITFRDTVGDARLLAASIGEPGMSSVSVSVPPGSARGEMQLAYFCSGGVGSTTFTFSPVAFQAALSASGAPTDCVSPLPADATQYLASEIAGVDELTLEATSADGEPADVPGLRLGIALYAAEGLTNGLSDTFEADGHLWRLTESSAIGEEDRDVAVPQGPRRLLVRVEVPRRRGFVQLDFGGRYAASRTSGGSLLVAELPPDVETVRVRVDDGPNNRGDAVIGFYELGD